MMKKHWWIVLSAGVLAIGLGGGYVLQSGDALRQGVPVMLTAAVTADMESTILTSGIVKVSNEHTLFASGSGDLRNYSIQEGDKVSKGQVIGSIDTSDVSNQIMDVEAQIAILEANIARLSKSVEPEEITKLQEELAQDERDHQTAQQQGSHRCRGRRCRRYAAWRKTGKNRCPARRF